MSKYITEGLAKILQNEGSFYNKSMTFNRDMCILLVDSYHKYTTVHNPHAQSGLSFCEGMAASGLRSIRMAKELPYLNKIVVNDLSDTAVESISANYHSNGLADTHFNLKTTTGLANSINNKSIFYDNSKDFIISKNDINDLHYILPNCFDVIDLDPYGSAFNLIDNAIKAIKNGGMLCVTCTDAGVFIGHGKSGACYYKYSSIPLKCKFPYEQSLRILLYYISTTALKHQKFIEPLLSLSVDYYIRVYVKVKNGKHVAENSASKVGNVYYCETCGYFNVSHLGKITKNNKVKCNMEYINVTYCPICDKQGMEIAGPIWLDKLHDKKFLKFILDNLNGNGQADHTHGKASHIDKESINSNHGKDHSENEINDDYKEIDKDIMSEIKIIKEDGNDEIDTEKDLSSNNGQFGYLQTFNRLNGIIQTAYEELDTVYGYHVDRIYSFVKKCVIKYSYIQESIRHINEEKQTDYEISIFHKDYLFYKVNFSYRSLLNLIKSYNASKLSEEVTIMFENEEVVLNWSDIIIKNQERYSKVHKKDKLKRKLIEKGIGPKERVAITK